MPDSDEPGPWNWWGYKPGIHHADGSGNGYGEGCGAGYGAGAGIAEGAYAGMGYGDGAAIFNLPPQERIVSRTQDVIEIDNWVYLEELYIFLWQAGIGTPSPAEIVGAIEDASDLTIRTIGTLLFVGRRPGTTIEEA